MNNYDMRIKNRNAVNQPYATKINGCIITASNIQSVPCVKIVNDESINRIIRDCHKKILEISAQRKDGHKYDEVGMLVEIVPPYQNSEVYLGKYNYTRHRSSISTNDPAYINYLALHKTNQLLFMHNHPNNSAISLGDFRNLVNTDQLIAVTAVGNNGQVYVMCKGNNFDSAKVNNYVMVEKQNYYKKCNRLTQQDIELIEERAFRHIINNPSTYDIWVRFSPRRGKSDE